MWKTKPCPPTSNIINIEAGSCLQNNYLNWILVDRASGEGV